MAICNRIARAQVVLYCFACMVHHGGDLSNWISGFCQFPGFIDLALLLLHCQLVLPFPGDCSAFWDFIFWYGKVFPEYMVNNASRAKKYAAPNGRRRIYRFLVFRQLSGSSADQGISFSSSSSGT